MAGRRPEAELEIHELLSTFPPLPPSLSLLLADIATPPQLPRFMFDSHRFVLFLSAAFLLSISPGPGIFYVLARTLKGGRREGLSSALGTAVGGLVHVIAAAFGLSAILMTSATAFAVVKYAGAAYLVYLGLTALLASRHKEISAIAPAAPANSAFWQGVVTEALNPKTAIFFLAFLPQFINPHGAVVLQFIVLGLISVALNTTADIVVVCFAAPLNGLLTRRPALQRGQQALSGTALIGLGAYVALSGDRKP